MKQTINFKLIKENPELFFSQLPEKARIEIDDFLNFLIFKYKINIEFPEKKQRFKNIIENPVKVKSKVKFTREELHER
jgi:hypothetical protein